MGDVPLRVVEFLSGLLIVVVYAAARFDTPVTPRGGTTAIRYFWGLLLYTTLLALAFGGLNSLGRATLGRGVAAIMAAVAVVVLPNVFPFSRLDLAVRRSLHEAIGAPMKAVRLADRLAVAEFQPNDAVAADVKLLLLHSGYDADENWLEAAGPTRALWFQTAVLFHQIRGWEHDRRYAGFLETVRGEFDALRERFDQLSLKVARRFHTIERLGSLAPHDDQVDTKEQAQAVRDVVKQLLVDLSEDISLFKRNTCALISRAILAETLTPSGRERRLKELGFARPWDPVGPVGMLGWAFVAYLVVMAVGLVPLSALDKGATRAALLLAGMIASIQVIALAVAIVPQLQAGFANEDIRGRTPLSFVLGTGLVAAVLAIPVQLGFLWLMHGGRSDGVWKDFGDACPWALMAFATAALTAFLVQDTRWSFLSSGSLKRVVDALVMASGYVATLSIVYLVYHLRGLRPRASLPLGMLMALIIGLAIGGMVPSAVRRTAKFMPRPRVMRPSRPSAIHA